MKGDKSTLLLCTNGTPNAEQKCAFRCKPMAPGIDDRCATASEAPPADAGADAAADAAANPAGGEPGAPAQHAAAPSPPETTKDAAEASLDAELDGAASGCSMAPTPAASHFAPLFGVSAALALLARRRRTR